MEIENTVLHFNKAKTKIYKYHNKKNVCMGITGRKIKAFFKLIFLLPYIYIIYASHSLVVFISIFILLIQFKWQYTHIIGNYIILLLSWVSGRNNICIYCARSIIVVGKLTVFNRYTYARLTDKRSYDLHCSKFK